MPPPAVGPCCGEFGRAERYPNAAELERALAACAAADEWNAVQAQSWWKLRGDAPTPEVDPAGRTVKIDPASRHAALQAAPGSSGARPRE
jgi:hypothetical protein